MHLAERIAKTIAAWIGRGEKLEATGKPCCAGDILVLVRKRDRVRTCAVARAEAHATSPSPAPTA